VGPRAGLDAVKQRKISFSAENLILAVQPAARLYTHRYPEFYLRMLIQFLTKSSKTLLQIYGNILDIYLRDWRNAIFSVILTLLSYLFH
jgi:hypothetical protein